MPVTWTNSQDQVDWSELEMLYRLAPLGNKSAGHLRTVFTNSRFKFFAHEHGKLVAAGRALSDGADCSYICDVAVMPSHQGSGLGREMVSRLVEASRGHKKIILYSVPGKEGFYRKLGFMGLLTAMAIFETKPPPSSGGTSVRPNPSLEATLHGLALGPRARAVYHRSRGPSANPRRSPQLKR